MSQPYHVVRGLRPRVELELAQVHTALGLPSFTYHSVCHKVTVSWPVVCFNYQHPGNDRSGLTGRKAAHRASLLHSLGRRPSQQRTLICLGNC